MVTDKEKNEISTLLWLDDLRDPYQGYWLEEYAEDFIGNEMGVIWVKSYYDFIGWIKKNGLPTMIAFDHDLGEDLAIALVKKGMVKRKAREIKQQEKTGYDCAKWVVDYCMENDVDFPEYTIQSANPVGKENIDKLIKNFKKFRGQD